MLDLTGAEGLASGAVGGAFLIELFRRVWKQRDQADTREAKALDEFKAQNHDSHKIIHEKIREESTARQELDKRVQSLELDRARNAKTLEGIHDDIREIKEAFNEAFPRRPRSGRSQQMPAVKDPRRD